MFHFSFPATGSLQVCSDRTELLPPLISFSFLLGALSGCVVGSFSSSAGEAVFSAGLFSAGILPVSVPSALWNSFRFIFAAAFFATGIFGVFLIPALSALRGFSFACSVAFLLQARSFSAFMIAFFSFGIPAFLCLPAFFLAATDSFFFSHSLLRRLPAMNLHGFPLAFHIVLILALCSANALYICVFLPKLLHLIS